MSGEIDVYGVFVPTLLALMLVTFAIATCMRALLARLGFYRLVWHRSLFNLAIYLIVLGGVVAIARSLQS
ncbi:membrane protein [Cupriavidus sp. SK-3]|nr:membrane protein [Cupriavidus sp. SK-3]